MVVVTDLTVSADDLSDGEIAVDFRTCIVVIWVKTLEEDVCQHRISVGLATQVAPLATEIAPDAAGVGHPVHRLRDVSVHAGRARPGDPTA